MPETMNIETVRTLAKKLRNWGRWGATDELGTVNFITPAKVKAAAGLVRQGKVISLAIPFDSNGPQTGFGGRVNPLHSMLQDGGDIVNGAQDFLPGLRYCDDAITMPLQCATQWDALSHIYFDGKMYNDRGPEQVTSNGARANAITALKDKIVTRGVLLDIPRLKGKPWLEPGEAIYPADLDAAAAAAKLRIESGDIVLIRTGQMAQVRDRGSWGDYAGGSAPGLSLTCAEWLATHEIAGYATDTWGTEVIPNETPDVFQPLHCVAIVNMGMLVGEIFTMEALADDCAADGVYEFLFVAPPLPITGAVGSPINPQAIK
jgi:kynurenine formamidase